MMPDVDQSGDTRIWVERLVGVKTAKSARAIRFFPGMAHEFVDRTHLPCQTVDTKTWRIVIERTAVRRYAPRVEPDKPLYRVPDMAEIAAIPWNGLTVASLFSGCGGSSLGYRMAGYRVLYANEFIEAARDSYAANQAPYTVLDGRDIRIVQPQDILDAMQLKAGELSVLDGSPPCSSFSTAGTREQGWAKVKAYSDTKQRTDDLFFEYARLLRGIQPKVFVAENVSGLVKGTAKGYFLDILADLKSCGYRVTAKLLDAQWLGVPQARQRIIFIGVRDDLDMAPAHPSPLPYRYSVREALPWIARIGGIATTGFSAGEMVASSNPSATIMAMGAGGMARHQYGVESEARVFHDTGGFVRDKDITDQVCPTITIGSGSNSGHYPVRQPAAQEGDIARYAIGDEWDKLKQGDQSKRYFSLVKPDADAPCPTVTQMGGVISAASITHPYEKRKFTIAELRRICAFPDDFILTGGYAQQWERLGRAVPPVMMEKIAAVVRDRILLPLRARKL